MGNLRVPLSLIRDHQRALVDMIPCDVTSFMMAYPDIPRHLAIVVLVAYLKETFCVNVLLEQFRSHQHANTGRYGADDLRRWLTRMMVQASGAPHLKELYVRRSSPYSAVRQSSSSRSISISSSSSSSQGARSAESTRSRQNHGFHDDLHIPGCD